MSGKYPAGTLVEWKSDKGIVIENCKMPGDICIRWYNGLIISYDECFLDENIKVFS